MDRGADISAIGAVARQRFDDKHTARETTIACSRRAIQCCAASIRATHRGEYGAAEQLAAEAASHLVQADAETESAPEVRGTGPLYDAKKEYVEARLTLAFVRDDALPGVDELNVDVAACLNGMAEAASELRRQLLDCLRHDRLERAEQLMGVMDDVYSVLVTIDYSDGVTGGLRRTTDALRAALERTRGDLTTTIVAARSRRPSTATAPPADRGAPPPRVAPDAHRPIRRSDLRLERDVERSVGHSRTPW